MSSHDDRLAEVAEELGRAEARWPPYRSPHEGFAVILEEVDELRAVVFETDPDVRTAKAAVALRLESDPDEEARRRAARAYARMRLRLARGEAMQVAATAVRFMALADAMLAEPEEAGS